MAVNECPNCGYSFLKSDKTCKYCGTPNPAYQEGRSNANQGANAYNAPFTKTEAEANFWKNFNWILFFILLIAFTPAAIIYLIIYVINKK